MLEDITAQIYKCSIQVHHISSLGWLFGSHEDVSLPVLEQVLNDTIASLAPNQEVPAICFGLNYKPIWDRISKNEKKRDQDHTKWVIHVEAIAEITLTSKAFLKQVLASSTFQVHINLPLLLVPILQKKTSSIKSKEIKCTIACHLMVLIPSPKVFLPRFSPLPDPSLFLSNTTLCSMLMALVTLEGKNSFSQPIPIGTAKVLLFPSLLYMPNKPVICEILTCLPFSLPWRRNLPLVHSQCGWWRESNGMGWGKATTNLIWWSYSSFHPSESESGMVLSPP